MPKRPSKRLSGQAVFERIALTSITNCLLEMKADGVRSGWLWLDNASEADAWLWNPIELHQSSPDMAVSMTASSAPKALLRQALTKIGRLEDGYRAAEALYLEIEQDLADIEAEGLASAFMWLGENNGYLWSPRASDATAVAVTVKPSDDPMTVLSRLTTTQCEVEADRLIALANGGDRTALLWLDILCYAAPEEVLEYA